MKALLITLASLVVLLVAADRGAAYAADQVAAKAIAEHAAFATPPHVSVHGFPFLTQAVRGVYSDIEIDGNGLRLGSVQGASLDAHLHGAHIPLSALVRRDVHQVPCDSVNGTVRLPYSELARLSKVPGLTFGDAGGELTATAALPVPLLNVTVHVTGSAQLLVQNGQVQLHVTNLAVDGRSLPGNVVQDLLGLLNVPIPLPTLPYGLRLTAVTPAATGVQVQAAGRSIVLGAG